MSDAVVFDTSAVLFYLDGERGSERLEEVIPSAYISIACWSELVGKLAERGVDERQIETVLNTLKTRVEPISPPQAFRAGMLKVKARGLGLSLADRLCIALAEDLGCPVYTTDKQWSKVKTRAKVIQLR